MVPNQYLLTPIGSWSTEIEQWFGYVAPICSRAPAARNSLALQALQRIHLSLQNYVILIIDFGYIQMVLKPIIDIT